MKKDKPLDKVNKIILDVISHFGTISLMDLWYELGESGDLKGQSVTEDEILSRLEFLTAKDFVTPVGDKWAIKE